jgi:hypothetical protein
LILEVYVDAYNGSYAYCADAPAEHLEQPSLEDVL